MKPKKILFCEDTIGDVELMKNELKKANMKYEYRWVDTKEEYLIEIKEFVPDVIVCDYSLPTFTGMDALLLLKKSELKIPFILVTGNLSEQLALDFLEEGVDDFLVKSSFGRVPTAIRKAIAKKKLENEKERIGDELVQSQIQLRALLKKMQVVREEERSRIALEIHDELGQQLTALKMDIDWVMLKQKNPEPKMIERLHEMLKLSDSIIKSVRRISFELRPAIIDDLGLMAALEWKCAEFEEKTGVPCLFIPHVKDRKFEKQFSITAFRILQETLTNVVRYANAKSVTVSVSENEKELMMEIKDDGIGISEDDMINKKTLGIFGMKERAMMLGGNLTVKGEPNKGTTTKLIIPFS